MENYQILQDALDKATQKGSFSLTETGIIMQALIKIVNDLKELENLRAEAEARKDLSKGETPVIDLKPKK